MEKIKKILKPENVLCFFIIICPILDIASFLYRNKFNTNYSISTFLRPIIPGIIFAYIFLKKNIKEKLKIIGIICVYILYAIIHLYIYYILKTGCSYGTIVHEVQYLVNYSFMIVNLFIFMNVFNKNNKEKIQKSIFISSAIYILSIIIAILTNTSSTTYIEGIGYKGWLESGNSVSTILVLSVFIIMSFIMKIEKKYVKILMFVNLMAIGIYLTTLIGTRVGLFGFVLAVLCFIIAQIYERIIRKVKINKKNFAILLSILILLVIIVVISGSITIKRRKHLEKMENTIIDQSTGEVSHLTGDLTSFRNKIVNDELEEDFMTEEQKKSITELYNLAKKYNISNTNTRAQQFIYHCMLIKNQKNFIYILFGNGYLINTNELVLEMEFPSILFNFGIIGFVLYMIPFLAICMKSAKIFFIKYKYVDSEFIMLFLASILSFVLSTLSGYSFFNSSSMIIIIIINVLLNCKTMEIERGDKI